MRGGVKRSLSTTNYDFAVPWIVSRGAGLQAVKSLNRGNVMLL
jgi:hypothetical protein